MHEAFAENEHDINIALSVEDNVVLNKYRESIAVNNNRYTISLPLRKCCITE